MSYGCFVDIAQQDGQPVRMFYPMTLHNRLVVEWIGINEQMAAKYRTPPQTNTGESDAD